MHVPEVQLHETTTLDEVASLLGRFAPDARLLAGGTDLLVDLKTGRAHCEHVISLRRIGALRGVSETADGLRIGALTTITELGRAPAVRWRFSPLLDATSVMATEQIRNAATVGGNLAAAVPCADLPPILTAMNASALLWSPRGERAVALQSFFLGPRQTALAGDEVLLAVTVPVPPTGFGAAYARFQLRDGNAIAVAGVAASLLLAADGRVSDARVVLGAVAPVPKLVTLAGAALVGRPPEESAFARAAEEAAAAAEPISDVRGSAEYRRQLVGVLTRRALANAHQRAQEGG